MQAETPEELLPEHEELAGLRDRMAIIMAAQTILWTAIEREPEGTLAFAGGLFTRLEAMAALFALRWTLGLDHVYMPRLLESADRLVRAEEASLTETVQ